MHGQKKHELSTANWIVKSNILNEIRHTKMDISQSKLFAIYLSKINPHDAGSRVVEFKLDEYAKIMGYGRLNVARMKQSASELIKLVIQYEESDGDGGFVMNSSLLFKTFRYFKNGAGEWAVSINCADDVLHLMFDLKKYFFKYQLWNVLQLPSSNHQRMYELMKQYETAGAREISVKDLREFLGLKPDEYKDWNNFRRRILEAAQTTLAQYTDIKFTWEVAARGGRGGKIETLKFNIEKNVGYKGQVSLDDFLVERGMPVIEGEPEEFEQTADGDILSFLSEACEGEFKREEIQVLHNIVLKIVPYKAEGLKGFDIRAYDYLKRKYDELNMRAGRTNIKSRFGYLKKIIEADMSE